MIWMSHIEGCADYRFNSKKKYHLPNLLYKDIRDILKEKSLKNFCTVNEYGFFAKLTPKMQSELVN